jgi:hypothetical protein
MPTYSVKAPNGKTYTLEGPPGATRDQVIAEVLRQDPSAATKPAAPSTKRTWGEAASDVGAGLTTGVGSLVGLPGDVYGLVTGDMDNAVSRAGDRLKDAGRAAESEGLKARRANKQEKVQAAEAEGGAWAAFKTAFTETIGDPALAASLLVEQIPNLALMIGTGGAAAAVAAGRASAAALARGATKEVATRVAKQAALRVGAPAAAGAGAVMQGADVGADTYDQLVQRLQAQGATQEQAASQAINAARAAGASATAVSYLVNRYMPGGMALERALMGKKTGLGMVLGAGTGAVKEVPTEVIEETVGGQLPKNVALRSVDPTQSLMQGMGAAGGDAAAGALVVRLRPRALRPPKTKPRSTRRRRASRPGTNNAPPAWRTPKKLRLCWRAPTTPRWSGASNSYCKARMPRAPQPK